MNSRDILYSQYNDLLYDDRHDKQNENVNNIFQNNDILQVFLKHITKYTEHIRKLNNKIKDLECSQNINYKKKHDVLLVKYDKLLQSHNIHLNNMTSTSRYIDKYCTEALTLFNANNSNNTNINNIVNLNHTEYESSEE